MHQHRASILKCISARFFFSFREHTTHTAREGEARGKAATERSYNCRRVRRTDRNSFNFRQQKKKKKREQAVRHEIQDSRPVGAVHAAVGNSKIKILYRLLQLSDLCCVKKLITPNLTHESSRQQAAVPAGRVGGVVSPVCSFNLVCFATENVCNITLLLVEEVNYCCSSHGLRLPGVSFR